MRLGVSVYPECSDLASIKKYLQQASKIGCKRIFSCLLSVDKSKDEIIADFREWIDYTHELGMEVIVDVSPSVFHKLDISYQDLSFFNDLHVDGLRLDEGFDGNVEACMTYNPYNLKIELNASVYNKMIDNIFAYAPNKNNLLACHNFYPQRYSGISFDHFKMCSETIKQHDLRLAAFVSSNNQDTFGPWPVNEGLCTLEMHRNLPIDLQIRHLVACGFIDDVIIANCYPSDEELEAIKNIPLDRIALKPKFEYELSPIEQEIVFNFDHQVRGDLSEYMLRSTMSRVVYHDADIKARNTRDLKKGDIVLVNNEYSRYKGEIQIVLKAMENDGRKNVIGHLDDNEMILLDHLKAWSHFSIIK